EFFFFIRICGRTIGEMLHSGQAWTAPGAGYSHHDALNRTGESDLVEHGANFLLDKLLIGQELWIPHIKIDDDAMVDGHFLDAGEKSARCIRQPEIRGICAKDMDVPAVFIVLGRYTAVAI